jgi:hypothetical protein
MYRFAIRKRGDSLCVNLHEMTSAWLPRMSLKYLFKAAQQIRGVTGFSISYYEIYNEVKGNPQVEYAGNFILNSFISLETGPQRPSASQWSISTYCT